MPRSVVCALWGLGAGPFCGRRIIERGTQQGVEESFPGTSASLWKIDGGHPRCNPARCNDLQTGKVLQHEVRGSPSVGENEWEQRRGGGETREREREAEKIAGAVPPFRHTSRCLRLSLPRCFSLFHFRPCLPVAEILRRSKVEASTFTLARRHAAGIYDAPFIGKRSFHSRGLRVWLFGRVNVARMSSSIFRLSLSLSLSFSVPYAVAPPPRFSS